MLRPVTLGYRFTIFFLEENRSARCVRFESVASRAHAKVSKPLRDGQRFVVRPLVAGRTGTAKIAEPSGRLAFRPPGWNI